MLQPYMAELVGEGGCFREIQGFIDEVAATSGPVILLGEPGTGKEVVARVIHFRSRRRNHPFLTVDASLYYERELERELFGLVDPGSGAVERRGLLEFSTKGTCYISNVEETSASVQERLLLYLRTGHLQRVGSVKLLPSRVRLVLSSGRDLRGFAAGGLFSRELLDEAGDAVAEIPPLRERPEDIVPFVTHIARCFSAEQLDGGARIRFTREALEALEAYPWPGNYDELKAEILRVLRSGSLDVTRDLLSPEIAHFWSGAGVEPEVRRVIEELETAMQEFRIMMRLDSEYGDVLSVTEEWDVGLKCLDRAG